MQPSLGKGSNKRRKTTHHCDVGVHETNHPLDHRADVSSKAMLNPVIASSHSPLHQIYPGLPYEVDIETERQIYVPKRRGSSTPTFSTYQSLPVPFSMTSNLQDRSSNAMIHNSRLVEVNYNKLPNPEQSHSKTRAESDIPCERTVINSPDLAWPSYNKRRRSFAGDDSASLSRLRFGAPVIPTSLDKNQDPVVTADLDMTYGIDHGHPDLDLPQSQDSTALNRNRQLMSTQSISVKIPLSLHPLPAILNENSMNLLYFHHFLNHTARHLVAHDCSANPFRTILLKSESFPTTHTCQTYIFLQDHPAITPLVTPLQRTRILMRYPHCLVLPSNML